MQISLCPHPQQLLIRLTDERSWASEPVSCTGPADLADAAIEAFAALRAEWTARVNAAVPAHQTIKRAQQEAARATQLAVQVCYHGEWAVVPPITPVVREPGTVAGREAFVDADWAGAWLRCQRTFAHVDNLGRGAAWAARARSRP